MPVNSSLVCPCVLRQQSNQGGGSLQKSAYRGRDYLVSVFHWLQQASHSGLSFIQNSQLLLFLSSISQAFPSALSRHFPMSNVISRTSFKQSFSFKQNGLDIYVAKKMFKIVCRHVCGPWEIYFCLPQKNGLIEKRNMIIGNVMKFTVIYEWTSRKCKTVQGLWIN